MLLKIKPPGIGSGARIDSGTDFLLGRSVYPSQVEPCPGKHQLSNIPTSQLPLVSRTGRVTEEVQGPKVKATRCMLEARYHQHDGSQNLHRPQSVPLAIAETRSVSKRL